MAALLLGVAAAGAPWLALWVSAEWILFGAPALGLLALLAGWQARRTWGGKFGMLLALAGLGVGGYLLLILSVYTGAH